VIKLLFKSENLFERGVIYLVDIFGAVVLAE